MGHIFLPSQNENSFVAFGGNRFLEISEGIHLCSDVNSRAHLRSSNTEQPSDCWSQYCFIIEAWGAEAHCLVLP